MQGQKLVPPQMDTHCFRFESQRPVHSPSIAQVVPLGLKLTQVLFVKLHPLPGAHPEKPEHEPPSGMGVLQAESTHVRPFSHSWAYKQGVPTPPSVLHCFNFALHTRWSSQELSRMHEAPWVPTGPHT